MPLMIPLMTTSTGGSYLNMSSGTLGNEFAEATEEAATDGLEALTHSNPFLGPGNLS